MTEKFYLNEKKVAEITGRALSTTQKRSFPRQGIPYVKCGRSVRYCFQDVIDWMDSRTINPNGTPKK